ncbi:hypothetical protein FKW77_007669 [Venturia effusa]|uniref:Uncharacterized protein n=1 Tax=Venturia effusa TaxID=50376 RepID=A0A517LCM1_9PEZI|nr:hypothetical protein FKW77_007669 [Venturia effusa]
MASPTSSQSDECSSTPPSDHGSDDESCSDPGSEDVLPGSSLSTASGVHTLPQYEYGNAPALKENQENSNHGFKATLYETLQDLGQPTVVHSQERLSSFTDPGLHIESLGLVSLPLYEHSISQITAMHNRPKSETVTSENNGSQTIWELDCSDSQFRNPDWRPHLQQIADNAGERMEVIGPVQAECYKLALIGSGASGEALARLADSQSSEAFGTLALCFPTEHEGGHIVLQTNNDT